MDEKSTENVKYLYENKVHHSLTVHDCLYILIIYAYMERCPPSMYILCKTLISALVMNKTIFFLSNERRQFVFSDSWIICNVITYL